MKRRNMTALVASLALVAVGVVSVGSASAALLGTATNSPFLAIYGTPAANGTAAATPLGGGLGRNFGFGENMLFTANATAPRAVLSITLETSPTTTATAAEADIGGTLMSNKTGVNTPLSFSIQFVDLQNSKIGATSVPTYADTSDRPWITEICSPEAAAHTCRPDPQAGVAAANEGSNPGEVVVQDVSLDLTNVPGVAGPVIVQGTVWGTWEGTKPPCIKLHLPPASPAGVHNETLFVTQPAALIGTRVNAISGTACLASANNDWFSGNEPAVTLKNE
jgi:hypothetical protein